MSEREDELHVGMADMKTGQSPLVLSSLGLGSCVGVALYYSRLQIGGLAHIMLPDIETVKNRSNRAKFANTAIPDLVQKLEEMGAERKYLKAKLIGGAHMFGFSENNRIFNVGVRNVEKAKEIFKEMRIRLIAEDTGGNYGRSLYFCLETGEVRVRTIAHGEKVI